MSLKNFLTSDIPGMMDTGEFAIEAIYTPVSSGPAKSVNIIFLNEYETAAVQGLEVDGTKPVALANASDIPDIAAGDTFEIDGILYTAINPIMPDGTGLVTITLREP